MRSFGLDGYLISKDGGVFSLKNNRFLKSRVNENGYLSIMLRGKVYKIHRLIAIAYIPNPLNKKTVNHIDGNKLNNSVKNLEWATHSENNKHAYISGLKSARHLRKHTDRDIEDIEYLYSIGWKNKHIAEKLNIPISVVQKRLSGRKKNKYRFTMDEMIEFKNKILNSKKTNIELSKEISLSSKIIGQIRRNIVWQEITPSLNKLNSGEA